MCVMSMVADHYWDKWKDIQRLDNKTWQVPSITEAEIEEFRKLLDRAREYDKKHNQPDCELQEKKDRLLKLADELGIKIDFL